MMQETDLQELAELVTEGVPILSLYLNVDPHRRSTEEHKLSLRRLLSQAAELGAAQADIDRIDRFFDHEYDRQGRGVACFSCQSQGFWRDYVLLLALEDAVFVGGRPYIKPLSDLWDAYARFGVVMADREGARVFIYHLGALEDSAGTLGSEVKRHKQGGWASQKLQRYEDQEAKHNLKDAAEWAAEYLKQHKVNRVVLSGSEANLALLRDVLPRALQDTVVGQINLDMNTSPAQVWERAVEITTAAQRQNEDELLEQTVTVARKGGAAVTGLADTLGAIQQGRVHHLLVGRELHQAGSQCAECRAIIIQEAEVCPYCGGSLTGTADVVNLVVQKALDSGVKVSVLDPSPRLDEIGGMAAVLRY